METVRILRKFWRRSALAIDPIDVTTDGESKSTYLLTYLLTYLPIDVTTDGESKSRAEKMLSPLQGILNYLRTYVRTYVRTYLLR